MSSTPGIAFRGAVVWAFTAFQPEAPFDLAGQDGAARSYPNAVEVAKAVKNGALADPPTFQVPAKIRPLVLLQDRPRGQLPEYAALKLARFTKLNDAEQQRVRDGEEPALFYLAKDEARYGLKQENAVDLNSLVRVHASSILTKPVGHLDVNEVDVLGRRLAKFLDIDLGPDIKAGIAERWEAIVAAQQARRSQP